jgi:hypothetical protein
MLEKGRAGGKSSLNKSSLNTSSLNPNARSLSRRRDWRAV